MSIAREMGERQIEGRKTSLERRLEHENERLRTALSGMFEHVKGEEFCLCEFKDRNEPADEGPAVELAKSALG